MLSGVVCHAVTRLDTACLPFNALVSPETCDCAMVGMSDADSDAPEVTNPLVSTVTLVNVPPVIAVFAVTFLSMLAWRAVSAEVRAEVSAFMLL